MAHNARVRAPGMWLTGTVLEGTELESIDAQLFGSIQGDAGGTYAPSSVITIGGSGLQVTGDFYATGYAEVGAGPSDQLFVNSTAQFEAPALFNDAVTLNAAVTFNSTAGFVGLATFDDADFNGLLHATGNAAFDATVAVGGTVNTVDLSVTSDTTLGSSGADTIQLNGSTTVNSPMTLNGSGHIRSRAVIGADANTTYNITSVDDIFIPGSGSILSASRIYTLADGTATGQRMRISTQETSYQITLRRADTTQIALLKGSGSGFKAWVEAIWISSAWQMIAYHEFA